MLESDNWQDIGKVTEIFNANFLLTSLKSISGKISSLIFSNIQVMERFCDINPIPFLN